MRAPTVRPELEVEDALYVVRVLVDRYNAAVERRMESGDDLLRAKRVAAQVNAALPPALQSSALDR